MRKALPILSALWLAVLVALAVAAGFYLVELEVKSEGPGWPGSLGRSMHPPAHSALVFCLTFAVVFILRYAYILCIAIPRKELRQYSQRSSL